MTEFKSLGRALMAHSRGRTLVAFLIAFATIVASGCSTGGNESPSIASAPGTGGSAAPEQVTPNKVGSTVGVWEGLSLANCSISAANRCNAQEKITLTLIQGDSRIGGFYKCAYSTMDCLGQNDTGKIVDAALNGPLLMTRVQMPDGTSCVYNGRIADNKINGGYSCYGGGALIEGGSWRGQRSY